MSDAMIIMSFAQFCRIIRRDCTRAEVIVMVNWHVSDYFHFSRHNSNARLEINAVFHTTKQEINCVCQFVLFVFCGAAAQCGPGPPHSWGFLITHNDASHSVGLLWTSDQPVAETSTWQHTTLTTDKHPCPGGIRTHNLSKRAAADLRLRPHGYWDWRVCQ